MVEIFFLIKFTKLILCRYYVSGPCSVNEIEVEKHKIMTREWKCVTQRILNLCDSIPWSIRLMLPWDTDSLLICTLRNDFEGGRKVGGLVVGDPTGLQNHFSPNWKKVGLYNKHHFSGYPIGKKIQVWRTTFLQPEKKSDFEKPLFSNKTKKSEFAEPLFWHPQNHF